MKLIKNHLKKLSKFKKLFATGAAAASKKFNFLGFMLMFLMGLAVVPGIWMLISLSAGFGKSVTVVGVSFILTLEIIVAAAITIGPLLFSKWFITTVSSPKHHWLMPLFSTLENGRSKVIVDLGDNARRHIMNYNDADFAREEGKKKNGKPADIHSDEYWEVIPAKSNVLNARNWWEALIESTTGLVFVGFYPFRRVRHRPITLYKIRKNSGKSELVVIPGRSKENPNGEMTDHSRVREFDWGVSATVVLKGFFQFKVLVFLRLKTTNPNKLQFGVDDWSLALNNALEACIVRSSRGMTPEQLMNEEETADRIKQAILDVVEFVEPKTKENWGLDIVQAEVMDYDWSLLKPHERAAMTAVEVAQRTREATVIEYDGEAVGQANVVGQRAQKILEYGKEGLAASEHEAIETAAEEGATLFVTVGGRSSQPNEDTLNAILAELRKERK